MKRAKSYLLLAASGMLALQCFLTPAAMASTSYSYYNTNIILNGSTISSPKHIVAVDPSSGVQTSFVPVWYVDYALGKLNIQANWDGVNGRLNLSVPSSFTIDLSSLPSTENVNSSNMSIAINGTVVSYAPRISYTDPSSGSLTTYVPVYYLEQTVKRLGVTPGWDGTNWTMTYSSSTGTGVTQTDIANAMWNVLNADNKRGVHVHATQSQAGINPDPKTAATAGDVANYLVNWAKASLGYNNQNTGVFVPFQLQYESSNDPFTWADTNDLFQGTSVTGPSSTLTISDESQIINNLEWWMNGYKVVNGVYSLHDILESHYAEYFGIITQYGETEAQYQQSMADAQNYMERVTFTGTAKGGAIKVTLPSSKSSSTITCYQVADGDYWYGWFGNDTVSQSQGGTTLSVPNNGGGLIVNVVSGKYNLIGTSATIPNSSSGLQLSQEYDGGVPAN